MCSCNRGATAQPARPDRRGCAEQQHQLSWGGHTQEASVGCSHSHGSCLPKHRASDSTRSCSCCKKFAFKCSALQSSTSQLQSTVAVQGYSLPESQAATALQLPTTAGATTSSFRTGAVDLRPWRHFRGVGAALRCVYPSRCPTWAVPGCLGREVTSMLAAITGRGASGVRFAVLADAPFAVHCASIAASKLTHAPMARPAAAASFIAEHVERAATGVAVTVGSHPDGAATGVAPGGGLLAGRTATGLQLAAAEVLHGGGAATGVATARGLQADRAAATLAAADGWHPGRAATGGATVVVPAALPSPSVSGAAAAAGGDAEAVASLTGAEAHSAQSGAAAVSVVVAALPCSARPAGTTAVAAGPAAVAPATACKDEKGTTALTLALRGCQSGAAAANGSDAVWPAAVEASAGLLHTGPGAAPAASPEDTRPAAASEAAAQAARLAAELHGTAASAALAISFTVCAAAPEPSATASPELPLAATEAAAQAARSAAVGHGTAASVALPILIRL